MAGKKGADTTDLTTKLTFKQRWNKARDWFRASNIVIRGLTIVLKHVSACLDELADLGGEPEGNADAA